MMIRKSVFVFALLLGLVHGSFGQEVDPGVIERGKQATLFVTVETVEGLVTGTAFCVEGSELFVTNAHVLMGKDGSDGRVKLVCTGEGANRRVVQARVLRTNPLYDLALLRTEPIPGVTALEIGADGDLVETRPVTTFGYPFGEALALDEREPPNVTVTSSRITSLRRNEGALRIVQIDGLLNPGNSGGPMLDARGRVVGVLTATVLGAGVNFAIAPGRLAAFLAAPTIEFVVPPIFYPHRAKPVKCKMKVTPSPVKSAPPLKQPEFDFGVLSSTGELRASNLKQVAPDSYEVEFVPLPLEFERDLEIQVTIPIDHFRSSFLQLVTHDRPIEVGKESLRLKDLGYVEYQPRSLILARDGRDFSGPIEGISAVPIQHKGEDALIDLRKMNAFSCWPLDEPVPTAELAIAAVCRDQGQVAGMVVRHVTFNDLPPDDVRQAAALRLLTLHAPAIPGFDVAASRGEPLDEGVHPALGTSSSIRPPQIDFGPSRDANSPAVAGTLVKMLPSPATNWVTGGGGRFLLFSVKQPPSLAVFDVNAADFVGSIPLPEPAAPAAAGGKFVAIIDRNASLLHRWSLDTLERGRVASPLRLKDPGGRDGLRLPGAADLLMA